MARPALLVMTGDQVYCDDVAGPMLAAIHQVIDRVELSPEPLTGATVADSAALMSSDAGYYRREDLLPHTQANRALQDIFFGGVRKPIFTTASAHNHLITLAEVTAMDLLVWSPVLWSMIWQITASGLKNQFPRRLLRWFDRVNLWLYGTSSPLNWFTRRRRMRLRARRPDGDRHRRLYNGSALGRVRLDAGGTPVDIRLLTADGGEVVFPEPP